MRNKKLTVIIVIIFIMVITIFICPVWINYKEMSIPPSQYKIKINRISKKLYVKEYHSSSAIDVQAREEENNIKLTNEEYKKIMKIILKKNVIFFNNENKEFLVDALSSIAKGDNVMIDSNITEFDIYDKEDDINNDGKVTYREFGDSYLNDILGVGVLDDPRKGNNGRIRKNEKICKIYLYNNFDTNYNMGNNIRNKFC